MEGVHLKFFVEFEGVHAIPLNIDKLYLIIQIKSGSFYYHFLSRTLTTQHNKIFPMLSLNQWIL